MYVSTDEEELQCHTNNRCITTITAAAAVTTTTTTTTTTNTNTTTTTSPNYIIHNSKI